MESVGSSKALICYSVSDKTYQFHQIFPATIAVKHLSDLPLVARNKQMCPFLLDDNH
jgi:hypothetical protein